MITVRVLLWRTPARKLKTMMTEMTVAACGRAREAYPAVPGYSIPPFGPLWVNKAPIGRQIGIAASLATKKVRPASEASKTSAWAIVAVTWDSGISLTKPAPSRKVLFEITTYENESVPWKQGVGLYAIPYCPFFPDTPCFACS